MFLILFLTIGGFTACDQVEDDATTPETTSDVGNPGGSVQPKNIPVGLGGSALASFVLETGIVDILGVTADSQTRDLVLTCRFSEEETPGLRRVHLRKADVEPGWSGVMYSISIPKSDSWVSVTLKINADGTMSHTSYRGPRDELTSSYTMNDDGLSASATYTLNSKTYKTTAWRSPPLSKDVDASSDSFGAQYAATSLPEYEHSARMLSSLVYDTAFQRWLLESGGEVLRRSTSSIESAIGEFDGYGDDPGVRDMCGWATVAAQCCWAATIFVPCWVPCVPGAFISAACGLIFMIDQVDEWWDNLFGGL